MGIAYLQNKRAMKNLIDKWKREIKQWEMSALDENFTDKTREMSKNRMIQLEYCLAELESVMANNEQIKSNCNIPHVSNQRELLIAFINDCEKKDKFPLIDMNDTIDEYLSNL